MKNIKTLRYLKKIYKCSFEDMVHTQGNVNLDLSEIKELKK